MHPLLAAALALLLALPGLALTPTPTPTPAPPARPPDLTAARVTRVIDGDTIDVRLGGRTVRVRLLGVDTPESVAPRAPVACFGREAAAYARELLAGQTVGLEADPSQDDRDRYGRLLRFVWLADGRMANEVLISEGYAFEYTFRTPHAYRDAFRAAEDAARAEGRGLWSPATCAGQAQPVTPTVASRTAPATPTAPPRATAPPAAAPAGRCDPSYPDVCIPPAPPDLDCGDIPHRRFRVVGADPHRFDGDNDGIGCER